MAFYGAFLTIAYAVLLHFNVFEVSSYFNLFYLQQIYILLSVQGIVFLSYPVIGFIADIKLTRHRMVHLSFWIIFISHILLLLGAIASYTIPHDYELSFWIAGTITVVTLSGSICAKGMFESTAIQFGIDQMIGASSSQLSTFIHWYYWSLHVGPVTYLFLEFFVEYYVANCFFNYEYEYEQIKSLLSVLMLLISVIQCLLCLVMFPLLYLKKFKMSLNIEPAGHNPVKEIIDVLKYAYKHKYPIRRSALTYYHNNYLSRINFGKAQYGGPFTNEQVENTKTVVRLFVLLLSLFGFNLTNEYSMSLTGHILHKACPSSLILYFFISNPSVISNFITISTIPIMIYLKNKKYFPNMMKRMWFGLLLMFLYQLCSFIIGTQITETSGCEAAKHIITDKINSFEICINSLYRLNNITEWNTTECVNICLSSSFTMDDKLVWLLIPQVLYGFGYMLVFMTTLEFICAQAPYTLKGFMIGIWYCMFSIKYILVGNVDLYIYDKGEVTWIIYESIKIGMIGLSVILFGISCRWYHYRERDEVVNVQGMIENIEIL